MEKKYQVISIGRSLVDIVCILNNDRYENIQKYLNARPGDWVEISSDEQLEFILNTVVKDKEQNDAGIKKAIDVQIRAGSTNLNVFSAFSKDIRTKSAIITAIGMDNMGNTDRFSSIYMEAVKNRCIDFISYPFIGKNPLSIVFASLHNPEKLMASFLGISSELNHIDNIASEFLYLDAYELGKGAISLLIRTLIETKKYKVILGLGNITILKGELLNLIKSYIEDGMIYMLCGNIYEYQRLSDYMADEEILSDNFLKNVEIMLLTHGKHGMTGMFGGNLLHQEAIELSRIVDTTGAGDTAAGAFISGIISNMKPEETMRNAAIKAFEYLSQKTLPYQANAEN